ncbi:hypothetical protein AHMF7605_11735 [Adhaeribacter arboris]|uniref:Uncharacterized protein n=1 Tax=Adhaeribacter arboris TaxID=2072846 RepID=A0A2T2YF63_9BACT|nr:hypothetical protein [Adhaeribacter arboris]PSR54142.1 hypothetical protein AHMF7605_11735 [Adhaeribacter arboris]
MEDQQIVNYNYKKGVRTIRPANKLVQNWLFNDNEEEEAVLANYLGVVAEKNGLSANVLSHLFPAILRMLKSNSEWAR